MSLLILYLGTWIFLKLKLTFYCNFSIQVFCVWNIYTYKFLPVCSIYQVFYLPLLGWSFFFRVIRKKISNFCFWWISWLGTNVWDMFELRVHKRMIDLYHSSTPLILWSKLLQTPLKMVWELKLSSLICINPFSFTKFLQLFYVQILYWKRSLPWILKNKMSWISIHA